MSNRWNRKFRYIEDSNSKVLEKMKEEQTKLIPRGDWVAGSDANPPEEDSVSFPALAKFFLVKFKDLVVPRMVDE